MIKNTTLLLSLLFVCKFIYAQNTSQFKESQYLNFDKKTDTYLTVKGDTVKLKIKKENGIEYFETGISINKSDTVFYKTKSKKYVYNDFKAKDFGLSKKRLYGDFVQNNGELKFYPWKFKNDSLIEKKITKYDYYIIKIPKRVVVKTKYSAWHYGALTLPVKFYSKATDSLSNTQFGANLNLMIGRKWGNKKYSHYAEKNPTPWTIAKSINIIAGIGELTLNPSNTENTLTKEIKVASLSYGLAFGFQYKKVGVFFASGFDTPLSKYGNNWVYKETLWLGFGLGLGL